jgi:hypothetical protein
LRYREQYDRMMRWYERFRAVAVESPLGRSVSHQRDDVFAFFESCLHVFEWIKYDEDVPQSVREAAWDHVQNDRTLKLCRYLAIGSKHLIVKNPVGDEKARIETRRAFDIVLSEGLSEGDERLLPPGVSIHNVTVRFYVETDSGQEDAFAFATMCVAAWAEFFKTHGLSTTGPGNLSGGESAARAC